MGADIYFITLEFEDCLNSHPVELSGLLIKRGIISSARFIRVLARLTANC